jgi:hypothetical protein
MVKHFAYSVWRGNPCDLNIVGFAINVLPEATSRFSDGSSWKSVDNFTFFSHCPWVWNCGKLTIIVNLNRKINSSSWYEKPPSISFVCHYTRHRDLPL